MTHSLKKSTAYSVEQHRNNPLVHQTPNMLYGRKVMVTIMKGKKPAITLIKMNTAVSSIHKNMASLTMQYITACKLCVMHHMSNHGQEKTKQHVLCNQDACINAYKLTLKFII
jgi:hypothetical protein